MGKRGQGQGEPEGGNTAKSGTSFGHPARATVRPAAKTAIFLGKFGIFRLVLG
jgi:hypothetical protein